MLNQRVITVPASGRATVRVGGEVAAATPIAAPFDAIARQLDDANLRQASESIRQEAFEDATRNAASALNDAAARIERAIDRAEEALSSDAVELGVEIARQILKLEIDAGNYDLERIVRATLGASDIKRGRCVVYLHPDDVEMLRGVTFRDETEIRPDADVPRGSCNVETPRGLLVRDADAALAEIREQLLEDLV